MNEEMDLFYHALNYRGASSENAELLWKELQACVDRIIAEKCEKENAELRKYLKVAIDEADAWCDDGHGNPVPEGENPEFDYARTLINKS